MLLIINPPRLAQGLIHSKSSGNTGLMKEWLSLWIWGQAALGPGSSSDVYEECGLL